MVYFNFYCFTDLLLIVIFFFLFIFLALPAEKKSKTRHFTLEPLDPDFHKQSNRISFPHARHGRSALPQAAVPGTLAAPTRTPRSPPERANRIKRAKPMQIAVNTTTVGAHPHPTKSSFLRPSRSCRVYFHASPRPNLRAIAMATKSQLQEQLIITRPDDWHLHLREGGVLEAVVPHRFVRS